MSREDVIYKAIDGLSDAIGALEELGGNSDKVLILRNLRMDLYGLFDEEEETLEGLVSQGYSEDDEECILADREAERYGSEQEKGLDAYLSSQE